MAIMKPTRVAVMRRVCLANAETTYPFKSANSALRSANSARDLAKSARRPCSRTLRSSLVAR